MDTGANVVGLVNGHPASEVLPEIKRCDPGTAPPDLSTRSYWLSLDPYKANSPLKGILEADVVIVGGGFTGLWTAYHVLKTNPGTRVVILEANSVGYGASGRNGGFAMTLVHRSLAALADAVGDDGAHAIYLAARDAIRNIEHVCAAEGINADLMPNGLITVSNTPPQDDIVRRELETADRLRLPGFHSLDKDLAQAEVHSPTFRMAVREEDCTLVNPARLVHGLKRAATRVGAQIFEGTPLVELSERDGHVFARTPEGLVRADRAVLATDGYSTLIPQLKNRLLSFYSYIQLTEPLTEEQWSRIGWKGREGMEDRRNFLHYFRPTVDGRILWGGRNAPFRADGPDPKYDRDEEVFRRGEETFRWTFPQLQDVAFKYAWGGPIGVTARFLPSVGWLKGERIAYGFGYNGHGVATSNLLGSCLRDLLLGRQTALTELPLVRLKPIYMPFPILRNPFVRLQTHSLLKADDKGKATKEPLLLRIFQKLG